MFVGVKKMSTEVWCIRESHVYSMLTKRKKKKSLGYAEPNEEKRIRSGKFHQPDTRFWSKERKKEPRKENPPKGERIDLLAFRRRAHSRPTHSSLSLPLSLSPSSRLHQKKKAEKKRNPPPLRSWLKIQPKGHIKKNHKSLRLGAYTSSGSTLRPTDRAAFPPSLFSSRLSCHCHVTVHTVGWYLE